MIQVFDNLLNLEALENNTSSYIRIITKFLYGQSVKIPNLKNHIKRNFLQIVIEDNGKGIEQMI